METTQRAYDDVYTEIKEHLEWQAITIYRHRREMTDEQRANMKAVMKDWYPLSETQEVMLEHLGQVEKDMLKK